MRGGSTLRAFDCVGVAAEYRVLREAIARRLSSIARAGTGRVGHAAQGKLVVLIGCLMSLIAPPMIHTAEEATLLTADERSGFEQRLAELSDRLAAKRESVSAGPATARDEWADVDVYRKGVQWALREQQVFTPADRRSIRASLEQGQVRLDGLLKGETPWSTQRGRAIRGYVSAVDGSTQPYGVIVPVGYDAQRSIRLDVVLHGSTKPMGMSELRFMDRFAEPGDPPAVDFIELHPLGRVENCYRWSGETDVWEAIDAACRHYNIDRRRVVLRGMSMGASGTWHLGLKHPDRFAAIGPYCGYVDTHQFSETPLPNFIKVPALPKHQELGLHMLDSIDYAANAEMVPSIAAIGDKDIFFQAHVIMRQAMEREGLTMTNLISPGTGHVIDPKTHAEQMSRIAEAVEQGLDRPRRRVRFVTYTLKYNRCYWLEIQGLDQHYQRAEVVAELTDDRVLDISRVDNVRRLAIDLEKLPQRPRLVRVKGQSVALMGMLPRLCLERQSDGWEQVAEDSPSWKLNKNKRPGLQGPIDDAFCSPLLCVQGTGTPWNAQVQTWANVSLLAFADEWRRYFRGELPVKRDTEVTAEDIERCHLILFGDPGSNSWIAKSLPHLPLTWTRDEVRIGQVSVSAGDHVPLLIQPNPLTTNHDRYLVINSGHTFQEAELNAVNYLLFPRLGDWAILSTTAGTVRRSDPHLFADPSVIAAGYFDESWR